MPQLTMEYQLRHKMVQIYTLRQITHFNIECQVLSNYVNSQT